MRLRIVVRSLGVILASPLVALPMGQAQTPAEVQAPHVVVTDAKAVKAAAPRVESAAAELLAPQAIAPAQNPAVSAEPHEISVACGGDGCVVQNGLELMVVAGKRAR